MSAAFSLELRRLPGQPPRFAVRYSCRNGRALVARQATWSVSEAELRSNGILDDLCVDDVLGGEFLFVGFDLADNGKFRLWDREAPALGRLTADQGWCAVSPCPVDRNPFFSLDTDELDFERPWARRRRLRRRAASPEPVTEPGVRRSRFVRPTLAERAIQPAASFRSTPGEHSGCFDMPGLYDLPPVPEPEPQHSRWDEREVLALPEAGLSVPTRDLGEGGGGVDDLLRVVRYLREELRMEREESTRLQRELARLQAVVAALVEQVPVS
jgi:hypothetical protein